jgi:hypothetical protein
MLNIVSFDSYRDGGTIVLKCNLGGPQWSKYLQCPPGHPRHLMISDEMEICLDGRIGNEPKIWLGYPGSDGSQLIEEKELIDDIINKIESFKNIQNHRMNKFIDFYENVRDWKIKNILE